MMDNKEREKLLKFPCEYPLKVIGKKSDQLEIAILNIFHKYVPNLKENCLRIAPSQNGNYVSVTVTFTAESLEQLNHLYAELSKCDLVLMTL